MLKNVCGVGLCDAILRKLPSFKHPVVDKKQKFNEPQTQVNYK